MALAVDMGVSNVGTCLLTFGVVFEGKQQPNKLQRVLVLGKTFTLEFTVLAGGANVRSERRVLEMYFVWSEC